MRPICWITWEDHRRSRELARRLGSEYLVIKAGGPSGVSHMLLALKTLGALWRKRHYTIFVQNPSRVLAAVASVLKLILRYPLIVDRHTNFRLGKGMSLNPAVWFVIVCSEFSIRVADLTIVTNTYLKDHVEKKGGRAFVLTDPIPPISLNHPGQKDQFLDHFTVFFVCTFSQDEPYLEVIEAARLLGDSVALQISGNYEKAGLRLDLMPANVELTGFVSNQKYDELISAASAVMALTSAEWCLVCGGYEAIGAEKPLITSGTKSLVEFYGDDAFFTPHTPEGIADTIRRVQNLQGSLGERGALIREKREKEWETSFFSLCQYVETYKTD